MTDDEALARALAEQARRSKVMADAQRHGPPRIADTPQLCACTSHTEAPCDQRDAIRICARSAAFLPSLVVEPGQQLVPVDLV